MKASRMNRRQISARVVVYAIECAAGIALTAAILFSRMGAA